MLRYAERLHGFQKYRIPFNSAENISEAHERAMGLLAELKDREGRFWNEWFAVAVRKGCSSRVPRRTIFVHLLMHTARRYAPFAALVRQHCFTAN